MWRNALPEDHFSGEPGFCPGDFVLLLCEEFGKSWIPMQYKPLHQPGVVQFARVEGWQIYRQSIAGMCVD
jgi:hypothetical protein